MNLFRNVKTLFDDDYFQSIRNLLDCGSWRDLKAFDRMRYVERVMERTPGFDDMETHS